MSEFGDFELVSDTPSDDGDNDDEIDVGYEDEEWRDDEDGDGGRGGEESSPVKINPEGDSSLKIGHTGIFNIIDMFSITFHEKTLGRVCLFWVSVNYYCILVLFLKRTTFVYCRRGRH